MSIQDILQDINADIDDLTEKRRLDAAARRYEETHFVSHEEAIRIVKLQEESTQLTKGLIDAILQPAIERLRKVKPVDLFRK